MKKEKKIALDELKQMKFTFIAANVILLAGCAIYGFLVEMDWRMFTGAVTGNIVSLLNFYLLGVSAGSVVRSRSEKRAVTLANGLYAVRYLGMFAVLGLGMKFKIIAPIPALIPLFFPRIHYFIKYIFLNKKEVIE